MKKLQREMGNQRQQPIGQRSIAATSIAQ